MFDPPIEIPGSSDCQRLEDELHKAKAEIARLQNQCQLADSQFSQIATAVGGDARHYKGDGEKTIANFVKQEIERLRAIVAAIDFLRKEEGDSVNIISDNADFNGLPNSLVVCYGNWAGHSVGKRFTADSIAEALLKAKTAREAAEAAEEEKHDCGD